MLQGMGGTSQSAQITLPSAEKLSYDLIGE